MNRNTIKGIATGFILTAVAGGTLAFAEPVKQNIEAVYNDIKIVIHGEQITPKDGDGNIVNPFIYDGTTYLPIRAVSEALGETVAWDGKNYTVYIGTTVIESTPAPTAVPKEMAKYIDGDPGLAADNIEPWEHYISRENITVSWDDPTRPRLKAGDTFIAEDGTAYLLEMGPSGVLGEGLPIATDLGRTVTVKGQVHIVRDGQRPGSPAFGWVYEGLPASQDKYVVNPYTGEGHWFGEWVKIRKNTMPTYTGSDGQLSEDGNWKYFEELGAWHFVVVF